MYGFFSVDLTLDDEDRPLLIEINGSNSGFDGFSIAHGDKRILDALVSAFDAFMGSRDIYVVTRLVNFGEIPRGYLDKLIEDRLYFQTLKNIHMTLPAGIAGVTWARFRTDRPPSGRGAPTSMDALSEMDNRFKRVFLNVSEPDYVIPTTHFDDKARSGVVSFKKDARVVARAIPIAADDVMWLRCPSLAYADRQPACFLLNEEFPYDAIADNKLFTYDLLESVLPGSLPRSIPVGNRVTGSQTVAAYLDSTKSEMFIRKPAVSSQARGIEILHRQDLVEYETRMRGLESQVGTSLELLGVPNLLAAGALSLDVSLVSELRLSKPIHCKPTARYHHGCIRSLAMVKQVRGGGLDIRYLGSYWRLARVPVDGDGLLWERYVGSQSQGAFCEPVSPKDEAITARFTETVLQAYVEECQSCPTNHTGYKLWEETYWLDRYRREAVQLSEPVEWAAFVAKIDEAKDKAEQAKRQAERRGFLRMPAVALTLDELRASSIPYLVEQPYRIVVPK
jgi:hypothetical protein